MNKKIFFAFIVILLVFTSCKTKEKASELNYMQNAEQIAREASINNSVSTIQKGDELIIFVLAKDMDVVKPFNQTYYSSQNSITNPTSTTSSQDKTYIVNPEGFIDFPILGAIQTTGKTLEMLKSEITERISAYVKKPTVTVKMSNFRITVLGEVDKPGQYNIPEGQGTLLNGLGLAGDLTIYGKRDDILVIRNDNGKITQEHVNLKDANFINSPFYQLKQGDVIYVSANRTQDKASRLDPSMPIYISVAGIVVTILALIFKK